MLEKNLLLTTLDSSSEQDSSDQVQMYAKEVLSLGLLLEEFLDVIREGDGLRILRCWKFLFLIFKCANRKNYALEAFYLLAQNALLPPRLREQQLWSIFVNISRKIAGNIPADLHNEHLNRVEKSALGNQRSNCLPKTVERTGNILGAL